MTQSSLWQNQHAAGDFTELCNALYQREINLIAKGNFTSAQAVQVRLKSLPYYINRTAHAMTAAAESNANPLNIDNQNASWWAKQTKKMPLNGQDDKEGIINSLAWYVTNDIQLGLVVPVLINDHLIVDCIDRIDVEKKRLRTNVGGWFELSETAIRQPEYNLSKRLLKPNKRVMISACAGHCWQGNNISQPIIPSLRELLLSCSINWQNFSKIRAI